MASLALTVGGFLLGGPLGGAIGGIVGSFLDQLLFPPKPIEGPRIDNFRVTSSAYGSVLPLVWGSEMRKPTQVIWSTDIVETKNTTSQGGKFGIGGQRTNNYTYSVTVALSVCRGPVVGFGRIWGDSKVIADFRSDNPGMTFPFRSENSVRNGTAKNRRYGHVTLHNGSNTQNPDSTIEAIQGAGNVPGYRDTAYILIKDLELADFANRLPVIQVEVIQSWGTTISDVLIDLCEECGLAGLYNTRAVNTHIRGVAIDSVGPARDIAGDIVDVFEVDACEIDGILHFLPRHRTPYARVRQEYLGARMEGDGHEKQRVITTAARIDIPNRMSITYLDPNRDYQSATEAISRVDSRSQGNAALNTSIVMSDRDARRIIENKMLALLRMRKTFEFTLPSEFFSSAAGDIIVIQDRNGNEFGVWSSRLTKTSGYLTKIQGALYSPPLEYFHDGTNNSTLQDLADPATSLTGTVIDCAPFEEDHDYSGLYMAAGCDISAWRAGAIWIDWDGAGYDYVADLPGPAAVGTASNVLGTPNSLEILDRVDTLTVVFESPSVVPTTATDGQFYNTRNILVVGKEVLAAQTVVANGNNSYTFSDLLRGLYGTEAYVSTHGANEVVVYADYGSLTRIAVPLSKIGSVYSVKFVPDGQDVADMSVAATDTFGAYSCWPFYVVDEEAHREDVFTPPSSPDWTVIKRNRTSPPGAPSDGDTYIVNAPSAGTWAGHDYEIAVAISISTPTPDWSVVELSNNPPTSYAVNDKALVRDYPAPTGAFIGHENQIANYEGSGSWTFQTPSLNDILLDNSTGDYYQWDGTDWNLYPLTGWTFYSPVVGWVAYDENKGEYVEWDGSSWNVMGATGDWIISWARRTRYDGDWGTSEDVPVNETSQEFEVDLWDGSTLIDTLTCGSEQEVRWTKADQIAYYGFQASYINYTIYQISARTGRGWPRNNDANA